jgi:hypothetical protein
MILQNRTIQTLCTTGLLFLALPEFTRAHNYQIGLQWIGLTFHPGQSGVEMPEYPRRLDPYGRWIWHWGLELNGIWFPSDEPFFSHSHLGARIALSVEKDCIDAWSGHVHGGPLLQTRWNQNHHFAEIGLGPTWIWRENWWIKPQVPWYQGDLFFGNTPSTKPWQNAFLWYGGNIGLGWREQKQHPWLVYSLVPGYPQVLVSSLGLRSD